MNYHDAKSIQPKDMISNECLKISIQYSLTKISVFQKTMEIFITTMNSIHFHRMMFIDWRAELRNKYYAIDVNILKDQRNVMNSQNEQFA